MRKKMTVLAMAVGVVAALALPASASANWKHHVTNISQTQDISVTGTAGFHGGLGGISCQFESTVTFTPGTTGTVDTFNMHPQDETTDCDASGGLNPCQIHNLSPQQGLNWTLHTSAWQTINQVHSNGQTTFGAQHPKAIVVTPGTLHSQLTGGIFCLIKTIQLHPGPIALTEEEPGLTYSNQETITNLDVNGSAIATIQTNGGAVHTEETLITGTVQVAAPSQNTYSL